MAEWNSCGSMGDMFQLSIELYDTEDMKVVWSDRWQEKWDNLPRHQDESI